MRYKSPQQYDRQCRLFVDAARGRSATIRVTRASIHVPIVLCIQCTFVWWGGGAGGGGEWGDNPVDP